MQLLHKQMRLVEVEFVGLAAQAFHRHGDQLGMGAIAGKSRIATRAPNLGARPFERTCLGHSGEIPAQCCLPHRPATFLTSLGLIEAAMTRTNAVLSSAVGAATSSTSRTAGSPKALNCIARMTRSSLRNFCHRTAEWHPMAITWDSHAPTRPIYRRRQPASDGAAQRQGFGRDRARTDPAATRAPDRDIP